MDAKDKILEFVLQNTQLKRSDITLLSIRPDGLTIDIKLSDQQLPSQQTLSSVTADGQTYQISC